MQAAAYNPYSQNTIPFPVALGIDGKPVLHLYAQLIHPNEIAEGIRLRDAAGISKPSGVEMGATVGMLQQFLTNLPEGKVVPYGRLTAVVGFPILENRWVLAAAMKKARQQDRVLIEAVTGIGVRRLSSAEAASASRKSVEKVHGAAIRGLEKLACARLSDVPKAERREYAATVRALSLASVATSKKTREAIMLGFDQGKVGIPDACDVLGEASAW